MATLKIGLTSGTLVTMPHPNGKSGDSTDFNLTKVEKITVGGARNITVTGRKTEDITLKFTNKNKTDFDILKQYCFPYVVGEYYVEIKNDSGTIYYEGFSHLELTGFSRRADNDEFKHFFDIIIKQL